MSCFFILFARFQIKNRKAFGPSFLYWVHFNLFEFEVKLVEKVSNTAKERDELSVCIFQDTREALTIIFQDEEVFDIIRGATLRLATLLAFIDFQAFLFVGLFVRSGARAL